MVLRWNIATSLRYATPRQAKNTPVLHPDYIGTAKGEQNNTKKYLTYCSEKLVIVRGEKTIEYRSYEET
ncbi:MAG: hypothetical protein KAW92_00565 [Candidatus Cloacimonetes bacterium]|nr:hypothetical protein [Candidatus Cloacimonadota bacterium]